MVLVGIIKTYKGYIMTHFKLASATRSAIIDAVSSDIQSNNKWIKAVDSLIADGVKASWVATEKKGGKPEVREEVRNAVTMGFTKDQQALISKDIKTLSDSEKADRRYVTQQIGSKLGEVERRLLKAESASDTSAPSIPMTKWTRFQDQLDKMISAVQDNEGATGLDAPSALKALKQAKGYMPKV